MTVGLSPLYSPDTPWEVVNSKTFSKIFHMFPDLLPGDGGGSVHQAPVAGDLPPLVGDEPHLESLDPGHHQGGLGHSSTETAHHPRRWRELPVSTCYLRLEAVEHSEPHSVGGDGPRKEDLDPAVHPPHSLLLEGLLNHVQRAAVNLLI